MNFGCGGPAVRVQGARVPAGGAQAAVPNLGEKVEAIKKASVIKPLIKKRELASLISPNALSVSDKGIHRPTPLRERGGERDWRHVWEAPK